jgi:hypothetical protein
MTCLQVSIQEGEELNLVVIDAEKVSWAGLDLMDQHASYLLFLSCSEHQPSSFQVCTHPK